MRSLVLLFALGAAACSTAHAATSPKNVAPAPPPKDDGNAAQGSKVGGDAHSAALEQLKIGPIVAKPDKQNSVLVPLPDGEHWTRVRFLTLPSLVGFRYGKEHHAIVAAFVTHVPDNTVQGACPQSFEDWAKPLLQAFDVELSHDTPTAFSWTMPKTDPKAPKQIAIVDVDSLMAKTATILAHEKYAAAWSAYPAWKGACLAVGVAVPLLDDEERAKAVRDRFVSEVLPKVVVTATAEPKERF
ncbi:MAG TPA: hypothetical protein VIF62_31040 [Labilithrix sp.]